jgi:crotonobetainyl-CoA:carnitine CoA-transferase CaiB-like acyl-CoA transferase
MPAQAASLPLQPYTVLDLTRARAGPTAARQLADWGADVIKVETPAALEGSAAIGGPRAGPDFQNLHRNKRSITLNLKDPQGLELFRKLARQADVVLENYRPDVKFRLGIDYQSLRTLHPGIIYGSISGFGEDGPYARRPGVDQVAQGMGGLMSITGEPGRGPMRVGIPITDLCAGLFCAIGVLNALLQRERSGEGCWVRTSLLEVMAFMLDFQATRWLMDGEVPGQAGNNHPTMIPSSVYRCKDGYINIATAGDHTWERLCDALAAEALLADPRFEGEAARLRNRDALNEAIGALTATRDSQELVAALNEGGVPSGPIYGIDQAFEDPQMKHLGIVQPVWHPERGEIRLVGQPVSLSGLDARLRAPAPERGQHTRDVLSGLGLSPADIDALARRNVV